MTDPTRQPKRWAAPALIAILAAVIVVVVVIGVVAAATSPRPAGSVVAAGGASASPAASSTPSTSSAPSASAPSASASASARPTITKATPVPAGSPQPTKTATITAPTTIVKALTAKVTKMEAVEGKANGPGEVAGPSVRFTITITNTTGKTVALSNTVVNAYYGPDSSPALELEQPGGKAFPASVKSGSAATGIFVFNIPTASRSKVEVSVDTSVNNPVVAFRGAAPR